MVKSELIQKLCDTHPNILHKDIEKILEIIFHEITNALSRGENIEIRRFGSYKIIQRKARIGRNPKTLEPVPIPAKKAIKWKMSKVLFSRLNNNLVNQ